MNLYADIFADQQQWDSAINELQQVLAIAEEIGDPGLAAGAHANLANALLRVDRLADARSHVDQIAATRADDADVLRLQARIAAKEGLASDAVTLMTAARNKAGES